MTRRYPERERRAAEKARQKKLVDRPRRLAVQKIIKRSAQDMQKVEK